MSLTYPSDAARTTTRLGIEAAFTWSATVFLGGGALAVVLQAIVGGTPIPWVAVAGFAALGALTWAARRLRRIPVLAGIGIVVVSAAAVGGIGWSLGSLGAPQTFALGSALIAATAIGSNVDRWTGSVGTLVSYLLAQLALLLVPGAGTPHVAALIIAVAVAFYYVVLGVARNISRSAARSLDDAALADIAVAERRTLERRSRALVHDTVLSELVALGMTRPGPLTERTRASIVASLESVRGPVHAATGTPSKTSSDLQAVVDRAIASGLTVTVSGEPSALAELDGPARAALVHAVDQALANVRKHAGVDEAEVSLATSGDRLVVAVVDGGVGFSEANIAPDRFGFRESIRGRLEAVGGDARILSSPGAGTSIVLSVPRGEASR